MGSESQEATLLDTSLRERGTQALIRTISIGDAETAARLSGELGYACEIDAMRERIAAVLVSAERKVYVACVGGAVVAWIDLAIVSHLASGRYGEIAGFIVSTDHRSNGIGQTLLHQAEQWMAAKGVNKIVVRSRTAREAAHRFYLREGYSLTKTSAVFSKELSL